jgi:hypothetical protein
LFLSPFWAFLGEGRSKTPHAHKYQKKNLTPVLFWPLTRPPTTPVGGGVAVFWFLGPLGGADARGFAATRAATRARCPTGRNARHCNK